MSNIVRAVVTTIREIPEEEVGKFIDLLAAQGSYCEKEGEKNPFVINDIRRDRLSRVKWIDTFGNWPAETIVEIVPQKDMN